MVQHSLEANKPEITIGVLGQDGHGKTSLTAAITQSLARQNGNVVAGDEIDMRNLWNCTEEMNAPSEYETAPRRYKLVDCRRHIDVWNDRIQEMLDGLDRNIPVPQSIADKPFLMSVDDVFTTTRAGIIVAGRVEGGSCHINNGVEMVGLGPTRLVHAVAMQQFHKNCDIIYAGDFASMNLYINRNDAKRGQVLATPGIIRAYSKFRAELYLRTEQENGRNRPDLSGANYLFFLRMIEMNGTLKREEGNDPVHEGEIARVTIELEMAIAMEPGLRFHLRQNDRSIGYGIVTETLA